MAVVCPRCLLSGDYDECPRCATEGVRVTYRESVPVTADRRRMGRLDPPVGMPKIAPEKRTPVTLTEWLGHQRRMRRS